MLQREAAIYSQLLLGHAPTLHMAQVLNLPLLTWRLTLLSLTQVALQRVAIFITLTLVLMQGLTYRQVQT